MLNLNEIGKKQQSELEKNIMFVTTIYDTFEALEETIGKLKLERPLFLIYLAKQAFAEEVFKYAQKDEQIYLSENKKSHSKQTLQ